MAETKGRPGERLVAGIRQWASSGHAEATDLQKEIVKSGCLRIEDAPDRERVTVQGTLRTVTLRPRGGVPALEAELYDGSGTILLIWLGRRRIAGIFPGRLIRVEGRIGLHNDSRIMYNPRYELR